jgi:multiple sugar transport system substrate-binding protein
MTDERMGWRTYATVGVVLTAVLVAMLLVAPDHPAPKAGAEPTAPVSSAPPTAVHLTFGVWGSDAEVAAYHSLAAAYELQHVGAQVEVRTYDSSEALAGALAGGDAPDVYLLDRADLATVMQRHLNRPLGSALIDRGINLGDDYSRDAVTAFSAADDLQCMPYTASPMVIYYNTGLIRFAKMKARGLNVPSDSNATFTLDEFRTAARVATRVHGGRAAGVAIEPSLRSLAPFVYSGGGHVFDNDAAPTRLALGDGGSADALRKTLEVLRDPRLSLSTQQLAQKSPVEWFEAGRVGMIAGFRDLVPQLRAVKGLHFDVLPMPAVGSQKTVGEFRGLCLSPGAAHPFDASADFLTYLVGDQAMSTLARTGSVQPTDLRVAYSNAFQQPRAEPANAVIFTNLLRTIQTAPLGVPWERLQTAVGPSLRQLLTTPVLDDLDQRLATIDKRSLQILEPPPTPTPGGSPTSSPS